VEHPYGTIKRQWGFSYILTKKGKARAGADVGFMLIAYNLRRIGNILTLNLLKEYLRVLVSLLLAIFGLTGAILRRFGAPGTLRPDYAVYCEFSGKNHYATRNLEETRFFV
jgi:hypothetical protein